MEDVSHREIYERLVTVEKKVDQVHTETRNVVNAFQSVEGAFTVLNWIAKAAKPILWVGGLAVGIVAAWDRFKVK